MKVRHKIIGKGGGVTIPAEIRRNYGFTGGAAVDISTEDGRLVIVPHTPRCLFCDAVENVGKYKDRYVCRSCVSEMVREVGAGG